MIDLVVPETCKGCGACCQIFNGIYVNPKDDVPEEFTVPCKPRIDEYGGVSRKQLRMVEGIQGRLSTCLAWDKSTGLCTTFDSCPRVCKTFQRGCYSCRIALLMANHGLDSFSARIWGGHGDFEEPKGGYGSKPETLQLGRRTLERRTIWYLGGEHPKEVGPWICTHCFQQADDHKKIRHRLLCVGRLFGDPFWWWYLDPRKWSHILRRRQNKLLWDPRTRQRAR